MPISIPVKTAIAALLLSAGAAHADITAYTSQSAYLSAVGTTGVDTFDDLAIDEYEGPLARAAGSFAYELGTGIDAESPMLWGASDDDVDFWVTPGYSSDRLVFTLTGPVAGAGGYFFGSDLSGYSTPLESITITATDSGGATLSWTIDAPEVNSFVGFVSDTTLTSVVVEAGEMDVFATANDFHISAPVPEPATYAMLLAGLGLLGHAARRRQRKS